MNRDMDPIEIRLEALKFRKSGARDQGDAPCPDDETFAAFMDGLLPEEEAAKLKHHLARCPECHMAYAAWQETAQPGGAPVPAHLLEAARSLVKPPLFRVVLKLLKDAFEIMNPGEFQLHAPLPAEVGGLRRREGAEAGSRHEIVEVQPGLEPLESIRIQRLEGTDTVKIAVIPAPDVPQDARKRIRIDLHDESGLIQSWPLQASGTSLNPIEKGRYRLSLVEITPSIDKHQVRFLGFVELDLT